VFKVATALSIDVSQKKRLEQLVGSHKALKKIRLRARIVLFASEGLQVLVGNSAALIA